MSLISTHDSQANVALRCAFKAAAPFEQTAHFLTTPHPKTFVRGTKRVAVNKIIACANENVMHPSNSQTLQMEELYLQEQSEKYTKIKNSFRKLFNRITAKAQPAILHVYVQSVNHKFGFPKTQRMITVSTTDNIVRALKKNNFDTDAYWYSYNGKPLGINHSFQDYNVCTNATFVAHSRLLGGSGKSRNIFQDISQMRVRPTRILFRRVVDHYMSPQDNDKIFINIQSNTTRYAVTRVTRTIYVSPNETIGCVFRRFELDVDNVWYLYQTKPLNLERTFRDYNMQSGSIIQCRQRLRGGSNTRICIPPYTHVMECEQRLLAELTPFRLQAEGLLPSTDSAQVNDFVTRCIESVKSAAGADEWLATTFENFFHIVYWLRKCDSYQDYAVNTALAYRLLTGKSICSEAWKLFRGTELQSDAYTAALDKMRDIFNVSKGVLHDPIVDKIRQVYSYLLVQGILTKLGLNVEVDEFQKLDRKCRDKLSDDKSMILNILDVSLTICERLNTWRLTGDWVSMLHNGASYDAWYKEADRLISLAPFTSNLQAHGTTYFSFVSDLRDTIERGTAISKYNIAANGLEITSIRKKLQSLQLLQNVEITRRSAQKERRAPFGALIHGGSSVGKSTFTKLLFYYYGKLHDLDTADHFRYVRNPADEYWSNFDSSKWCVQLDDIAYLLPTKVTEADPTLNEIICLINNVPYVPPQAALEDKGKTPVMAELVIATTNTPDLNAQEYFSCPLAVRRRLPFIVQIEPKEEYMAENGKFLDPKKLPKVSGAYPDYWKITLQELVPTEYYGRDSAQLKNIKEFDNIQDFLKEFAKYSFAHKNIQTKSEDCDGDMRDLKVCRLCYNVGDNCDCLQSHFVVVNYLITYVLHTFINWILLLLTFRFFHYFYRFKINRYIVLYLANMLPAPLQRFHAGFVNTMNNPAFQRKILRIVQVGAYLANVLLWWKIMQTVGNTRRDRHKKKSAERVAKGEQFDERWCAAYDCDQNDEEHREMRERSFDLHGNVLGTTEEDFATDVKANVWYTPTIELSQFDVPSASASNASLTTAQIRDLMSENCVRLQIEATDSNHKCRTGGVYVRGQYLMFNRHALGEASRFRIKLIAGPVAQGITPNVTFLAQRSEMIEYGERDIVIMRVRNAPPRKDILKYWNDVQIPVTNMISIMRGMDGYTTFNEIFNVQYKSDFPIERLNRDMPLYMGKSTKESQVGECGSLGVAITPRGPVIMGVHTIGYINSIGFPHITRSEIMSMLDENDLSFIEGGGKPAFSLQSDVHLQPPHHKSIFRYIETGILNFYGTIPGFIAKGKSRVCATPFQQEMLDHFDVELDHGAPALNGWEPWRKNIVEMVKPNCAIDQTLLQDCAKNFARDIVSGLQMKHGDAWKGELLTLSDRASINGLPGVKFIDAINKNSSMGAPWNKTKKSFLVAAPCERYPEGVDFTNEVWDRVRSIEDLYRDRKRANPVYTAHLKDESISLAKIAEKKTRMFTGAPIDFSLVMRKQLLSFVRLVQNNIFIFEACPGVVCQSREWSKIYQHLTCFGKDRMVAGDYSKFDKRMTADVILAAFDVIRSVHKAAGYSDEDLVQISSLALDVAFPIVNCRGDIAMFFGTNPSGHPLTVIINSLVNSLYMRYAFAKLNPEKRDCSEFQTRVHLLTYGDDNIMGVSVDTPWFSHTQIQEALAHFGVVYTMADKETESVPFININQCSFLKRTWRWDEEMQAYACPLEEASIHKSLTVWVASQTIDRYKQMVDVVTAANNEYFFHGREEFDKHHRFLCEITDIEPFDQYKTSSTLLSWDALHERFKRASE